MCTDLPHSQIAWPLVPWVHLSNTRIISPGLSASGKLKDKIRLGMWQLFEFSFLLLGTSWQVYSPTLLSDLSSLMGIIVSKLGLFVLLLTQSGPLPHYTLWRLLPDSLLQFPEGRKRQVYWRNRHSEKWWKMLRYFLLNSPIKTLSAECWSSGLFSYTLPASIVLSSWYFPFLFFK